MRVTDRLIQDAKKREKRRRAPGDEAEEAYTYLPRTRQKAVNQEPGAFGSVMGDGINTRGSVFDEGAVFRVGGRQEEQG